jgi:hypothetical protein
MFILVVMTLNNVIIFINKIKIVKINSIRHIITTEITKRNTLKKFIF